LKEVTKARPYLPSFFGRGDDPFGSLFREVQKTFEDFSQRTPFARFSADTLSPKIDIAESKDAVDVTAELPGVDEKDLDVTLANGVLTIRGEKKTERDEQDKDKNWHVVERSYGAFSRAIPLPFDADPAKVEAKLAGDGKAEPRAAEALGDCGLGLGEFLEQLCLLLRGQADAGIRNRKVVGHRVSASPHASISPRPDRSAAGPLSRAYI
jgi:HSP20 family protein